MATRRDLFIDQDLRIRTCFVCGNKYDDISRIDSVLHMDNIQPRGQSSKPPVVFDIIHDIFFHINTIV